MNRSVCVGVAEREGVCLCVCVDLGKVLVSEYLSRYVNAKARMCMQRGRESVSSRTSQYLPTYLGTMCVYFCFRERERGREKSWNRF